jgi:hypothetical protein
MLVTPLVFTERQKEGSKKVRSAFVPSPKKEKDLEKFAANRIAIIASCTWTIKRDGPPSFFLMAQNNIFEEKKITLGLEKEKNVSPTTPSLKSSCRQRKKFFMNTTQKTV